MILVKSVFNARANDDATNKPIANRKYDFSCDFLIELIGFDIIIVSLNLQIIIIDEIMNDLSMYETSW